MAGVTTRDATPANVSTAYPTTGNVDFKRDAFSATAPPIVTTKPHKKRRHAMR